MGRAAGPETQSGPPWSPACRRLSGSRRQLPQRARRTQDNSIDPGPYYSPGVPVSEVLADSAVGGSRLVVPGTARPAEEGLGAALAGALAVRVTAPGT